MRLLVPILTGVELRALRGKFVENLFIKPDTRNALLQAAWFGLFVGLIEGGAVYLLQQHKWLAGPFVFLGGSSEVFWISPIFNLLFFSLIGFSLAIFLSFFRSLPAKHIILSAYTFLAALNLSSIPLVGHTRLAAIFILSVGLAFQATRYIIDRETAYIHFIKKSFAWLVIFTIILFISVQGGNLFKEYYQQIALPEPKLESPNIIVIVIDTLRADHLSSYGYLRETSPSIDRISQEGALFVNAIAPAPWTKPTHASLLTGRYPHEHGADGSEILDNKFLTIGEVLQLSGYHTGAFSANYETFNKLNGFGRGFQHFEDFYQSSLNMLSHTVYGRILEYYVLHRLLDMKYRLDRKRAPDVNESLLNWIDQRKNLPFFAFLNYYDVHLPYTPPQPYRSKFSQVDKPGGRMNTDWGMDQIYINLTIDQLQEEIDAYDGSIAYVDAHIDKLFQGLDKRRLLENTLIIILSDHGESFGEHGLLEHNNSLYREVIHVPLIFWWPGHVPANIRIEQPVSITAIPATIQSLVGEDSEKYFPDPELNILWSNSISQPKWPAPIAEAEQNTWVPEQHLTSSGAIQAVVNQDWTYIEHEIFGSELYSWSNDPHQSNNLINLPELKPIVEEAITLLEVLSEGKQ